jgi:hypothetical protein
LLNPVQANCHRLNRLRESQKSIPTYPFLRARERFNEASFFLWIIISLGFV